MFGLVLNEANLAVTLWNFQCFPLCKVDGIDNCLNLFRWPTLSDFNFG